MFANNSRSKMNLRNLKHPFVNIGKEETEAAQVFSCEFCEISKNTFFTQHVWTTASMETCATFKQKIFNSMVVRAMVSRKQ